MDYLGGFFAKPRPMLAGDFVTTDSGTGLVHMSPDHGEDDFDLCKANSIDPVFAVEADGKYRADWGWLGGEGSVINPKFNAPDGPICTALREAGGLLAASADYKHSYPHSWRSKAKVIYRCTPQWFVSMDKPLPMGVSSSLDTNGEGGPALKRIGESGTIISNPFVSSEDETPGSHAPTLRQTAIQAIAATRFIPEKGRNRLSSMVEGRPDWVLSRQRAWGVPITLFVKKGTNQYLNDAAVNARIIAGVRENGVDGWSDERAQEYLGSDYALADYERVTDILDVWFDSGCTHVFTLESGRWPDLQWPADLYLEGSDQHRGWFQSSLLQSCGTRGRAPYEAVLTHGFTMDQQGHENVQVAGQYDQPARPDARQRRGYLAALGADRGLHRRPPDRQGNPCKACPTSIANCAIRFAICWARWTDFRTRRKVAVADMPELERYMLHLLADMDAKLKVAVNDFDFNSYVRLLTDFANEDLSAFFFDIRKDCLYCDAPTDPKRMAYRTVLDILFHALVRYAAPVLVFTSEEVWQTRFPDADSSTSRTGPNSLSFAPCDTGLELGTAEKSLSSRRRLKDEWVPRLRWGSELRSRRVNSKQLSPMRRDKTDWFQS